MKHKKLLSLLLAVCMVLALLPTVAFADTVEYVETEVGSLTTGDIVVITMTNDVATYALPNNNGTSAPTVTTVTVSGTKLNGSIEDTLKWVVTVNDGNYQFNVPDTDNYLYCTNNNNGVRVGTNTNNAFTITDDYLYNTATKRYIGIYNSQDWRCYTSINNNIQYQILKVYKETTSSGDDPQPTYTVTPATNNSSWGTVAIADSVITATPAEGCYVAGYTVSPEGAATVKQNGNVFTVSNVTEDCTVTINFAAKTPVTVSFNPNGGTSTMEDVTVYQEDPYTLPACRFTAPDGKEFDYWSIDGDEGVYAPGDSYALTGDTTFVAQWKDLPTDMKLKSVPANGDEVVIYYPTASVLMTGTQDTYTQSGSTRVCLLATEATLTNDILAVPSDALRLTVTVDNDKYTFSTGEGAETKYLYADGTDVKLVTEQGAYTLFQLERIAGTDNYFIKCDSATHNGNAQYLEYYGSSFRVWTMNTGNAGIYTFQFFAEDGEGPTQFNTYTVTYVTNEGTGSMELVTVTEGASHTLLANGFTAPENKHFAGWKVNDDDTLRAPGYVIENITADVTVTAQWESDSAADTKLFKLVTSVDQLKAGDKVIIVSTNNGSGYGMGYQNGNVRAALAVSGISGKIVLADSAFSTAQDYTQLTEFTLGGNAAAGWTFYDAEYDGGNGGYLGAVSSGSNYIGTQADVDGEAQFDLVFGSNGAAQATAKGENTRNTIRYNYNNGNPRFSCYGSNSNLSPTIYIYKELTDGYWLVGPDWTIDGIDIGNNFISNPGNDSEYMLTTSLKAGDQFKVAKVENNAITKFNPDTWNHNDGQGEVVTKPYGYYDDQKLTADGNYTIYFKPNYTGGDDWYYKCIYVVTNSTKPTFMTQSLTLGDEIGVNFYLNLDMLDADTKAASYMTFAITGKGAGDLKTTKVPFDAEKTNDKGYYGFTCRVNALQMADTITATLHYGDGQTIEKTYSVKQYILKFMENKDDYSEKTVNLVMALADYGHYVQAMLAAQKGFELGPTTYAEMDTFYTTYTTSYDFEDIRSKVAEKGITFNNDNGAAFSKLSFMMVFDSATELRILFKTPSTGTIAATVDGKSAEVTTIGTSKAVQIKEIPAHWLSHPFTIVITIDGSSATITASALSYVKLLLATDNATYQHAAAAAIYNYSVAADAYKTANTNP